MSPRPYHSPVRDSTAAQTRARIIEAARGLLGGPGAATFTIERIAATAGVSRMTVYNQFGSKRGLVEALSDELAAQGGIQRLREVFDAPDGVTGLETLIEVFAGFWERQRRVLGPLRAVIALDPELRQSNRDHLRREHLLAVLRRLSRETGHPAPEELETAADLLLVLTSFECYESLRAAGHDQQRLVGLLTAAARRVVGVEAPPTPNGAPPFRSERGS